MRSWGTVARPVIIARMRLLNPVRTTIATWTIRKSRRNAETKKCSVRADCRPPSAVDGRRNRGIEGRRHRQARPDYSGNRTKITIR